MERRALAPESLLKSNPKRTIIKTDFRRNEFASMRKPISLITKD